MSSQPHPVEFAYLSLLQEVLDTGQHRPGTRTGVDTLGVWDRRLVADLRDGFPLLTTKKLPFPSITAELSGLLRGCTSAAQFRALGTKIWDANANVTASWLDNPARKGEDDLGRIYGAQWRNWLTVPFDPAYPDSYPEGAEDTDQIDTLLEGLVQDPYGRRHIVTAWNPGELNQMALPPCHMLFQCYVERAADSAQMNILHLKMTQRSADLFLGVPFNLASYALLLQIIATVVDMTPGKVTIDMGDVHLYQNHLDQVRRQLSRLPFNAPEVVLRRRAAFDPGNHIRRGHPQRALIEWSPADLELIGYAPHPALPAPMAA